MTQSIAGAKIEGAAPGRGGRVLFAEDTPETPGEGGALVWSPAGRGDCRTFSEAYDAVQASKAPIRLYVDQRAGDPPLIVPAGRYEFRGGGFWAYGFGDPFLNEIDCEPGTLFRNLYNSGATKLVSNQATPLLENDSTNPGSSPPIYILRDGAMLRNDHPTSALVKVGPAGFAFLGILNSGGMDTGCFADLAPGEVLGIATQGSEPNIGPGTVKGALGSICGLLQGGNITVPIAATLFPGFLGTLVNLPSQQDGGSGATAYRPSSLFGMVPSGCMYFDTTLGIPVWWTGPDSPTPNIWIDATGAPA